MPFPQDSVLPPDSLILVTGATGYVAGVVVDQLLQHGFRVRGTVRDSNSGKAEWLPEHFDLNYGKGKFEMVEVSNLAEEKCLDDAVKGCSGVIHVASVLAFEADPHKIVTPSLAFLNNALSAAAKEPSVKRFVHTSSSSAVMQNRINEVYDLTADMWCEWAVPAAWAPPPYTLDRAFANYMASKVQPEQELWKYVREERPSFVVNSVLPDYVLGLPLDLEKQGHVSSMAMVKAMFEDDKNNETWRAIPPHWCVDVVDTALLHIAALTHPGVKGERIFAYGQRKTWTDFIKRFERMYPERKFPEPPLNEGEDLSNVVGRPKAEELLRWMGRSGFRPLDDLLREIGNGYVGRA